VENNDNTQSSWPFEEAGSLITRVNGSVPNKGYILFETGYGPSGLPHIGTFGEVARTTMVMHALKTVRPDIPLKLFAFSDDMDGLRKVPDNIPNREMVAKHLGKPLTSIPDPFGEKESYGHYMNNRLCGFLDDFGFSYEFKSATDCYKSGVFDAALLQVLQKYNEILEVMLPTLGNERRETYSPFMPLCPLTGQVLQAGVEEVRPESGTIIYRDATGKLVETEVTGGKCKLQWKVDWAMRWYALGVDYEMYGKDLIPSAELSTKICNILGGRAPNGFSYELFLDEKGQKISKSKGNGLTLEDWLRYAPPESLALYMFQSPKRAKRLYFDVIPRAVDDYQTFLTKYQNEDETKRRDNPAWHIHSGNPPKPESDLSFALLLNLASACNPEDKSVIWGFISRYSKGATPVNSPWLDKMAGYAVSYYHDFVKPTKVYRRATEAEHSALLALSEAIHAAPTNATAEELQTMAYEIGKQNGFAELKDWFKAIYEVLLGQSQGPRVGSFIALYGRTETIALINRALSGELTKAA